MGENNAKPANSSWRWKAVTTLAAAFVALGLSWTEAYAKALDMVPEEPDMPRLVQAAVTATSAEYSPFNQGIFAQEHAGQHWMAAAKIHREWAQWELWTASGPSAGDTAVNRVVPLLTDVSSGFVSYLYMHVPDGDDETE